MADAGDGLPLKAGGGGEQCPGGGEEHLPPLPLPEPRQDIAVQHRRRAAAAAASRMHVLSLPVIEQEAAVLVVPGEVQPVPPEEVQHDAVAQGSQVPGEDQVIVPGGGAAVSEESGEGVVGGGGRSQGCTMWKMFSVKFNAYSSPEARRF